MKCTNNQNMKRNIYFPSPRYVDPLPRHEGMPRVSPHTPPVLDRPPVPTTKQIS